jgi:hypothetical protein
MNAAAKDDLHHFMNVDIFCDLEPRSSYVSDVLEEHVTSIFTVENSRVTNQREAVR